MLPYYYKSSDLSTYKDKIKKGAPMSGERIWKYTVLLHAGPVGNAGLSQKCMHGILDGRGPEKCLLGPFVEFCKNLR